VLDRLVFGASPDVIRDVMVAGRWVVRDRHHAAEAAVGRRFSEWLRRRT